MTPTSKLTMRTILASDLHALAQDHVVSEFSEHCSSKSSVPDTNSMHFDENEFAVEKFLITMAVEESDQPFHQLRNDLRVVVQLNSDDAEILAGRIGHDVGEITVEGNEHGAEFLRLGDDHGIERANGQDISQQRDLMSVLAQRVGDLPERIGR